MSWSRIATLAALFVVTVTIAGVYSAARQPEPAARRAYMIAQGEVSDPDQYAAYVKVAPDIVAKYGGRYLARGGMRVTLEGPPAPSRVVIIEFPSLDAARQFYDSPEYTAARKLREGAAEVQFVVVEAL